MPHGEAPGRETGVHPAVNKYDQLGHSSLFMLLQETMFMKTHPSIYKKKKKVFELLKSNVNLGQSGRPPAQSPRTTSVLGYTDLEQSPAGFQGQTPWLLQSQTCKGAPSPDLRNSTQFNGMYLDANVTVSLTHQTQTKKASSPNLGLWNQQANLYEGTLRITHGRGLPPDFPLLIM